MLSRGGLGLLEKKAGSAGNDSDRSPGCTSERSTALACSRQEKKSDLWKRVTSVRVDGVEGGKNRKMAQLLFFSTRNKRYSPAKPTALDDAQQTSPDGYSDMSACESPLTHGSEALVRVVPTAREQALYGALTRNQRVPNVNVTTWSQDPIATSVMDSALEINNRMLGCHS